MIEKSINDKLTLQVEEFSLYDYIEISERLSDLSDLKAKERAIEIFSIIGGYKNISLVNEHKEAVNLKDRKELDLALINDRQAIYSIIKAISSALDEVSVAGK